SFSELRGSVTTLVVIPGPREARNPESILILLENPMDCKVHPWTLPFGPTFGCSNSFQTNLSDLRRNDERGISSLIEGTVTASLCGAMSCVPIFLPTPTSIAATSCKAQAFPCSRLPPARHA